MTRCRGVITRPSSAPVRSGPRRDSRPARTSRSRDRGRRFGPSSSSPSEAVRQDRGDRQGSESHHPWQTDPVRPPLLLVNEGREARLGTASLRKRIHQVFDFGTNFSVPLRRWLPQWFPPSVLQSHCANAHTAPVPGIHGHPTLNAVTPLASPRSVHRSCGQRAILTPRRALGEPAAFSSARALSRSPQSAPRPA